MRIFALFVASACLSASAVPTTFTYTGYVTNVNSGGISGFTSPWNNPGIVVNSPVSLSYTFESTTPDTDGSPIGGLYLAVSQVSLTLGPASNTVNFGSPQRLYVSNDLVFPTFTTDRYSLMAFNVGGNSDYLQFQFDDTNYSVFNSDTLPLSPPSPASFTNFYGELKSNGFIPARINFVLNNVPEPAMLSLFAPALALMHRRSRGA